MYSPPPYRSRSAVTLQSDDSLGPTRPPIPQAAPRFHSIPNAPTIPQSAQRFHSIPSARPPVPQSAPRFYSIQNAPASRPQCPSQRVSLPVPLAPRYKDFRSTVPSRQSFSTSQIPHGTIAQTVKPQTLRKIHAFVASSPFRVFRDDDNIDVPSDGLTFDDIPTAESAPGTELSQGRVNKFHGALPNQTLGGLPNSAPPLAGRYAQSSSPTQSISHNSRPSREPEVLINQMPDTVPPISNYQVEYPEVPPVIIPMSFMGSSSAEQFTSQVFPDLLEPLRRDYGQQLSALLSLGIVHHFLIIPKNQPSLVLFVSSDSDGHIQVVCSVHSPRLDLLHSSTVPVIYHDSEIEWYKFVLKFISTHLAPTPLTLFLSCSDVLAWPGSQKPS